MAKSKYDRELEKAYKRMEYSERERKKNRNDLLSFFIGIILFGGGLFLIFQNTQVQSTWGYGYFYHIGTWGVPNGLVLLPLIIGIVMLFMMERKIFGWIVMLIGIVFILMSIILSVRISWRTTSVYVFVVMFGMVAAGGGLILKALFSKR